MPEEKDSIRFVERGDKILMKQDAPKDFEMDSRELLIQIDQLEGVITKTKAQMEQMKANIEHGEKSIKTNTKRLNTLKKFQVKMTVIQESKAKALFNEVKKECEERVRKEYKYDQALIEADNKVQMFAIYQKYIATHPRVAKELAPKIIKRMYYIDRETGKENILDNPFK